MTPNPRAELKALVSAARRLLPTLAVKAPVATIDDIVSGFENDLGTLVQEFLRLGRHLSLADFRRQMKSMIKAYARETFDAGWTEGGGDVADTEADDIALLEEFTREQQGFVNDFSDWLGAKDSDLDTVPVRVTTWAASMRNIGDQAKARAMGDPQLMFDGSDGKESCNECQEYKGQTHRLSWWEKRGLTKRNGNDAFGCGRWEPCEHHFFHARSGELIIA